jgi:hypothetical protein
MGVASCRSIFLLSDVVFNRDIVSFRFGFRFVIGFRSVVSCVVGFCPGPRPSPARPDLAQPGPAQRAPASPMRPLSPFSLIQFSRTATPSPPPLSLPPCALGDPVTVIAGFWIPEVSSPSLSLPLSLPLPSLFPPCMPPFLPPPSRVRLCGLPRAAAWLIAVPWSGGTACPNHPTRRRGPAPASPPAWPRDPVPAPTRPLVARQHVPAHTTPGRATINFSLNSFEFSSINVLRRALCRATN